MRKTAILAGLVLAGCGGKHETTTVAVDLPQFATTKHLTVTTLAVSPRGTLQSDFTASGAGTEPTISWSGVPVEAKEVEVLVEDPDAPGDVPYVHLLAEGIDPAQTQFPGKSGERVENTSGKKRYSPPNPPPGTPHHYHFEVIALDRHVGFPLARDELFKQMTKHVVASGEIVGTYGGQ